MDDVSRGGAARLARVAHNHKVVGSNPTPATKKDFEIRFGVFFVYACKVNSQILFLSQRLLSID
jgi:hypothetical protein